MLQKVASGRPVKEVCREHGVSTASYSAWKAKYAGLDINEARRFEELELENRRLKRTLVDLTLREQALKASTPRELVL